MNGLPMHFEEAVGWTCMLEERGVEAMLRHGDWSDRQAAQPYASADEQAAVSLASACQFIDVSDDDM